MKRNLVEIKSMCDMGEEQIAEVQDRIAKKKDVVMMVHLTDCHYCNYVRPHFKKLAEDNPDLPFIILEVTCDKEKFKRAFNFMTVPTLFYFKDGKEFFRHGSEKKSVTSETMQANLDRIYGS